MQAAPAQRLRHALTLALLAVLAAVLALHWPDALLHGLPQGTAKAALLVVFTIGAWAVGLMPEPLVTLVFFLYAVLFHIAPVPVIFSGFASPAWWLVFGGAVIGLAIRDTGLGSRLSAVAFRHALHSYPRLVAAVACSAVALAFVMPSTTGRVLLLMPIVLALAEHVGLPSGSRGRTGLVLAAATASYMPATAILPANIPNSVLLGAAHTAYGVQLEYGPYLWLHFPVLGILKLLAIIGMVCWLFPIDAPLRAKPLPPAGRMSRDEKVLVGILVVSLLCFATDAWHGISPAWVALASAIACLLPAAGLVSPKTFSDQTPLTPLVYVAGFLGLGAIVKSSGLGNLIGQILLDAVGMTPGHTLANTGVLAAIQAGIGLLTTLPVLPAVLTPLSADFAHASGLPLYTVLMLQVPVFSTVLLPYQSPPIMISMQLGRVALRDGTRLCLALVVLTLVALLPLDYLWWRLLGDLP